MELGDFDESGRRRPVPIKGSEFTLEVDTVLPAIGQRSNLSFIAKESGISINSSNNINVAPVTSATNVEGIFAGGDVVTGPGSVIEAIAAGRMEAASIDQYLGGDGILDVEPVEFEESDYLVKEWIGVSSSDTMQKISLSQRITGFDEVSKGLTEDQALVQAKRCLRCDLPLVIDASQCCGCLICELRCSMRKGGEFNLGNANIQVRRQIDKETEYTVSLADECDNCGLCVRYCPYGALTRGKREEA
jgi:formate dehydrogenase (NADP+) beta subunit